MKRQRLWGMALAALLAFGSTGCGDGGKLTTGTVDSVALVQSDPDYQKMAADYAKARVKMETEINKSIKAAGGPGNLSQADITRFREKNANLDKEWSKKTDAFLKKRFDRIVAAAEAVCKDKDIDLVLVDTAGFPTVEYGAVNITQDIELKLQQNAGEPKKK